MANKPGVMIYFETAKAIKGLDYETKGRLFDAIMEYAEDGVIPAFDGVLAAVWPFITNSIDRDSARYEEIRQTRVEAGRKGGLARVSKAKQKEANKANATFDKQIKPTPTSTSTSKREKAPARHKYGEYSNVLLSDEELEKLQAEFPRDWKKRIDRLSEYIASTGKTYKNHLATIRTWARKDGVNNAEDNKQDHVERLKAAIGADNRIFRTVDDL